MKNLDPPPHRTRANTDRWYGNLPLTRELKRDISPDSVIRGFRVKPNLNGIVSRIGVGKAGQGTCAGTTYIDRSPNTETVNSDSSSFYMCVSIYLLSPRRERRNGLKRETSLR